MDVAVESGKGEGNLAVSYEETAMDAWLFQMEGLF